MKVVFLDAGTLPAALVFADPRIEYIPYAHTAPDQVAGRIRDARVVITNKVRISSRDMDAAGKLGLIAVAAAGTDNIDKVAAQARDIDVQNVPDYGSESVAEHVIASLFALRRHIIEYSAAATDGRWAASHQFCWSGPVIRDIGQSTLGIVGRGRTGQAVGRLAEGLGMKVSYAQGASSQGRADALPLDELLATADAISLHVPLTDATRGMIDAAALAKMKADAVLVNTGRGALVDIAALVAALRTRQLAGAAIDVLEVEPPPQNHPLLDKSIPNLICTPHVAWASVQAQARLGARLAEIVARHASFSVK